VKILRPTINYHYVPYYPIVAVGFSVNTVNFARSIERPPTALDFPSEKGHFLANGNSLSTFQVLSYAVGHVGNDLSACCWFTYTRKL